MLKLFYGRLMTEAGHDFMNNKFDYEAYAGESDDPAKIDTNVVNVVSKDVKQGTEKHSGSNELRDDDWSEIFENVA